MAVADFFAKEDLDMAVQACGLIWQAAQWAANSLCGQAVEEVSSSVHELSLPAAAPVPKGKAAETWLSTDSNKPHSARPPAASQSAAAAPKGGAAETWLSTDSNTVPKGGAAETWLSIDSNKPHSARPPAASQSVAAVQKGGAVETRQRAASQCTTTAPQGSVAASQKSPGPSMVGDQNASSLASGVQPKGLYDRIAFPAFDDIPDEDDIDHKHYLDNVGTHIFACRHWCLLGQIDDVSSFIRVGMVVRDWKGRAFMVHVHIEEHTSTLNLFDIKKGNVIALMNPEAHYFMDGTTGIRLEAPDSAFVFRSSLSHLMEEGRKILKGQFCFQCGNPAKESCNKCSVARYCSPTCQLKHWQGGHKELCSQMLVLRNLLDADLSAPPIQQYHSFRSLASTLSTEDEVGLGDLPRPCCCGFQDKELSNSEECLAIGLENHVDYPPASCLPGSEDPSQQFYYTADGVPQRHWAIIAEVDEVAQDRLLVETRFGEQVHVIASSGWDKSRW